MNRKPIIIGILASFLLLGGMMALDPQDFSFFSIKPVWGADSMGNDINWTSVSQYNGSSWVLLVNWTTSGNTQRINAGLQIRFIVQIQFNSSLVSSTSEAVTYSNVTMNITYNAGAAYIWTEQALNNTVSVLSGSYYYVTYQGDWNSTLPVAGTTYNCTEKAWFSY